MNSFTFRFWQIVFLSMIFCFDSFATNSDAFLFQQYLKRRRGLGNLIMSDQFNKKSNGEELESKFSDKQALVDVCRQLRQLCINSANDDSVTYQALIDKARELVRADDEYKAKAHLLTALFFGYPSIKKGFLIVSSFTLGYGFGWLSFGQ